MTSASFACRLCRGVAATVWLASPRESAAATARGVGSTADTRYVRLVVESGPLSLTIGGEVVELATRAILAALAAADAEALHAVNVEFAPFWCPPCRAAHCGEHWQTWLVFDEEDPTWLEEQRGICPEGHERMLID